MEEEAVVVVEEEAVVVVVMAVEEEAVVVVVMAEAGEGAVCRWWRCREGRRAHRLGQLAPELVLPPGGGHRDQILPEPARRAVSKLLSRRLAARARAAAWRPAGVCALGLLHQQRLERHHGRDADLEDREDARELRRVEARR